MKPFIISIFLGTSLLIASCKSYDYKVTQIYKDRVEIDRFPTYYNDDLGFKMEFNACHDIETEGFSIKRLDIPGFIAKQIRKTVKPPSEVLFYSKDCIIDSNSTHLMGVVYASGKSLPQFTKDILKVIKRSGKHIENLKFTTDYVHQKKGAAEHPYFFSVNSKLLTTTPVNRVSYQVNKDGVQWGVEEYHFAFKNHILRYICFADIEQTKKALLRGAKWQEMLRINLELNMFNFRDSIGYTKALD